ncbi:MAG: hypothetical protein WDW36_006413 [Sanguina aurantia]
MTGGPSAASAVLLLYAVLLLMIGAQAGLYWFRKKHKRAYDLATLFGLWLMPPIFCVQLHYWRFLAVWFCYSCATGWLLSLCLKKKLELSTPRRVYQFFLVMYRISRTLGLLGYTLLLINTVNGGAVGSAFHLPKDAFIDLLWYGLYFGVLGRDCAEVASDSMASGMGSQGRKLLTQVNKCGVCGNELEDGLHVCNVQPVDAELALRHAHNNTNLAMIGRGWVAACLPAWSSGGVVVMTRWSGKPPASGGAPPGRAGQAAEVGERVVQLQCNHSFHDLCIRGWTVVGKKDTCPTCCEKVDLGKLYADRPWETRNLTWLQMLDSLRYLIVWNPIIFLIINLGVHVFQWQPFGHHHALLHGAGNFTLGNATLAGGLNATLALSA